ncbi:MAG: VCBS repeat-containing protein, partial [Planctomycetes bacterium]|nr:VCBS repeat-containing protein [Planctomycetota bacterium]
MRSLTTIATGATLLCLAPMARAQWATFQDQTATRLNCAPGLGAADTQEKDYAWADFDQDGDTDLVVVRKSPYVTAGHFPNVFLRNENGVLTDRTAALASASLVPGSLGMLDATNDTDVVAVDVDGDGWIDLVTATTLTATQPQYIRVPRVYRNLGNQLGVWQGFLYDDPLRIDDMQPGASWNGEQRFATVAAGDVDADGDIDLYFGDYQAGGARSIDVDDRLLLNNGAGYFTDATAARTTATMVASTFTVTAALADMNLDGRLDIVKADAPTPNEVSIAYNTPANPGFFAGYQIALTSPVYGFSVGDLNNDNLPDLVYSDDGQDRYQLHTGVVAGQATFGPPIA